MTKLITFLFLFFFVSSQAQKEYVLESEFLSKKDTVWAFIPENVKDENKFPTIILLHGYSGNYRQWDKLLNLQKMADEYGFIFVCPDGLYNSWYIDVPNNAGQRYESYFFNTLFPWMINELPVDQDRLFIDGLSMGGHGAIRFFLQRPHLFKAAGSTSGVLDLRCSGLRKTDLKKKLGAYNANVWKDYTAIGQIGKQNIGNTPMIIDCGLQDHLLDCNRDFVKVGRKAGYNITYIEKNGKHNGKYWKNTFYLHLAFYSKVLDTKRNSK